MFAVKSLSMGECAARVVQARLTSSGIGRAITVVAREQRFAELVLELGAVGELAIQVGVRADDCLAPR